MKPTLCRRWLMPLGVLFVLSGCASTNAGFIPDDDVVAEGETIVAGVPEAVSIRRVVDGDSLEGIVAGEGEEVRLVGVNAPELDQCGGPEAKAALQRALDGQTVRMTINPDEPRDQFGRMLGSLFVDGADIAVALVRNGIVIPLGGSSSSFHEHALAASKDQVGIWSPDRCAAAQPGLTIESFVPNPAGADDQPGAGEFIELRNQLDADLDLAGWVVHDESTSNRYEFSAETLAAGEGLRLYSTCGSDGGGDFFMCDSDSVWNNSGDTAFVVDPNGNVVDFRFSP